MNTFQFNMGATVTIIASGEFGQVVGRAEYIVGENQYFVRYCARDGRAVEVWWGASALMLDASAGAAHE